MRRAPLGVGSSGVFTNRFDWTRNIGGCLGVAQRRTTTHLSAVASKSLANRSARIPQPPTAIDIRAAPIVTSFAKAMRDPFCFVQILLHLCPSCKPRTSFGGFPLLFSRPLQKDECGQHVKRGRDVSSGYDRKCSMYSCRELTLPFEAQSVQPDYLRH